MADRGPKPMTAANSAAGRKGLIRRDSFDPPSSLDEAADAEYRRLLGVLAEKGSIDRVDLGVVAECARVKALLDRAHVMVSKFLDPLALKMVSTLTSQRRGLLRELGLTLQPSRSLVKTTPIPAEEDPLAGRIKLSG